MPRVEVEEACLAFAINLRTDSGDQIVNLWSQAALYEPRPSMEALGYPPHLTLGIYDALDLDEAGRVLGQLQAYPPVEVTFTQIDHFDADPLVLWLRPADDRQLRRLHAAVQAAIDPERCRPHYRPGQWRPHCTIAMAVPMRHRAEALAFAARPFAPIRTTFDVVDAVSFHPVEVLAARRLVSAPSS